MNKAERLAVAGIVAPSLRGSADTVRNRRVALVGADGNVVGYTTLGEVQRSLLLTRQIEIAVQDDVRPTEIICRNCGRPVAVPTKVGPIRTTCREACGGQKTCAHEGCLEIPSAYAFRPPQVRRRNGQPWRCVKHRCAHRKLPLTSEKIAHRADDQRTRSRRWREKNREAYNARRAANRKSRAKAPP